MCKHIEIILFDSIRYEKPNLVKLFGDEQYWLAMCLECESTIVRTIDGYVPTNQFRAVKDNGYDGNYQIYKVIENGKNQHENKVCQSTERV